VEAKVIDRAQILANLHLHAVLPRLEELVKLDAEARSIASEMDLRVRFRVRGGPQTAISIEKGTVTASGDRSAKADLGLFFVNCDQLNNMFMDKVAVPIPYKHLLQLRHMTRFTKLTGIMTRYLKPSSANLEDPDFKKKHVEMTLMVGLSGAGEIAKYDRRMRKVVDRLPHGTIQFSVLPDGPFAHVSVDENKNIAVQNGKIDHPVANLDLNGVGLAADLLSDNLDTFAAVGSGDIKASGLLSLIDEFNALLDRVGHYLA
jgi:hypothetical protein